MSTLALEPMMTKLWYILACSVSVFMQQLLLVFIAVSVHNIHGRFVYAGVLIASIVCVPSIL